MIYLACVAFLLVVLNGFAIHALVRVTRQNTDLTTMLVRAVVSRNGGELAHLERAAASAPRVDQRAVDQSARAMFKRRQQELIDLAEMGDAVADRLEAPQFAEGLNG